MTTVAEAIAILTAVNGNTYDASTNAGGLDGTGGMDANLVAAFNSIAVIGSLLTTLSMPAATSQTNRTIGAGSHPFTLDNAVSLPIGVYLIVKTSEIGNPVNFMLGYLAAAITESTSFTVSVPTGGTGGSGANASWAICSLTSKVSPVRAISGSDTQLVADRDGFIRYTGSGGHTETMLSAATAGSGFITTFVHAGTGVWTVGSTAFAAADSKTYRSNGTTWELISANGGGLTAAQVWAAILAS